MGSQPTDGVRRTITKVTVLGLCHGPTPHTDVEVLETDPPSDTPYTLQLSWEGVTAKRR